jgi:predicted transcriptional regulator
MLPRRQPRRARRNSLEFRTNVLPASSLTLLCFLYVNFLTFRLDAFLPKVKILTHERTGTELEARVLTHLSRRERQIMEVVYSKGEVTATDVLDVLPDAPSRTAVRTFLRILEAKGELKHKKRSREFVYFPTRQRARAGKSAFHRVLQTFFDGSLEKAVAAHLADPSAEIGADELRRLSDLIREAKRKET